VRAFSLHPGSIANTGLGKHFSRADLQAAGVIDENGHPILNPEKNLKTPEQGAVTSVWCATSPQLNGMGGLYCENSDVAPLLPEKNETQGNNNPRTEDEDTVRRIGSMALGVMPYAVDPKAADRLWTLSERLTGSSIQ
jgi:hypothetical protein